MSRQSLVTSRSSPGSNPYERDEASNLGYHSPPRSSNQSVPASNQPSIAMLDCFEHRLVKDSSDVDGL